MEGNMSERKLIEVYSDSKAKTESTISVTMRLVGNWRFHRVYCFFSPRRVERKIRRLCGLIMRKMRTTRSLLEKWEVVAHQQVGVVTRTQQLTNVFC